MPKTKHLRDETKYRLLPPLDAETYAGLKANISINGVQVPVVKDEKGYILDGFARAKIAKELGYECSSVTVRGLSEQEKRSLVRALNIARRHLDQRAKREIIATELRENPERSNRWIAKSLGVSHPTVASVREEMASTGKIFQLDRTVGSDGKSRPARFQLSSLIVEPRALKGAPDSEEEAILRAAAEIRKRRVIDRWNQFQEQRLKTQPRPSFKKGVASVLCGDCISLIPELDDGSVSLVVTSPPYCEQRSGHYEGVPEDQYPEFTVAWMSALLPKLREDGSVLIVIRPHLRDGIISDYVLRTRLALREVGWCECEELIWVKPNAPPLGSKARPRRSWESILWYSRSNKPYCDLKACGKASSRIGFDGSIRFADQGIDDQTAWHPCVESVGQRIGTARVPDIVIAPVGSEEPRLDHPAVFPLVLADQLVRTFSQEGDLVLDPFCGSAQTLLAAKGCGRRYLGIEREEKYVRIALGRLR